MYHNSYSRLSLKLCKISIENNLCVIAMSYELNVEASKKNDGLEGRFYFCIYLGISYALSILSQPFNKFYEISKTFERRFYLWLPSI